MSHTPSNPNEIGRGVVSFVGDTSNVKKAAAETVAVTEQATTTAQAAVNRVEGAYVKEAQAATEAGDATAKAGVKATAPWRFLITTIGGVIGGFIAIARAAQTIVSVMESGESKAARFMLALKDEGGVKQLDAIADRIAKLQEVAGGNGNPLDDFMDIVRSVTGEGAREIETLTTLQKAAMLKAVGEKEKAELDAQAAVAASAKRIRDEAFSATLDEGQRITANEAKKLKEIETLRKDARTKENQDALDDAAKYVKEAARIEMQQHERTLADKRVAERQAEEERRRDADETARRQAESIAKELGRVLSSVQQQANALFSPDRLGVQIEALGRIMERVANNTRNRD